MDVFVVSIIVISAMTYLFWRWFRKKSTRAAQGKTNPCEGCTRACDSSCQPPQ